jgi:3-oxoacyl-[acyl-carrier protein] reductase
MDGIDPTMLAGKVVWVTASARGLGRAIAERLAKCGASMVVHSRSDKTPAEFGEANSTHDVADEMAKIGNPITTVFVDVSDPDQVKAAVAKIEEDLGPIDILVNNAGGDIAAKGGKPEPNGAYDVSSEDVKSILDRNLITTVDCCREVVPGMIARGSGASSTSDPSQDSRGAQTVSSTRPPRPPRPITRGASLRNCARTTSPST